MTTRKLETMSDWLSIGTDMKINELMHYLNTLKNQLDNMAEEYTRRIEVELKKKESDEEKNGFYIWSEEDYYRYKEIFPRIFLNSFHITAYSFLESELKLIAERVGKKQQQVSAISRNKGGGHFIPSISYIKEITGINVANTFRSWDKLIKGKRLREIITHSNGILKKIEDIDLAKKYNVLLEESRIELPSVRSKSIKEVSITYDYCVFFLDAIRAFFAELYERMKIGDFL